MSPDQPTTRRRRTSRASTGALALAAATALTAALLPGLAQSATAGPAATGPAAGLPAAPAITAEDRRAPASTVGEQLLTATLTTPTAPVDRGQPFAVTGTVSTVAEGVVGRALDGVPADFTLQVTDPEGRVLAERKLTAGPDGRFRTTVPGSVTADAPGTEATALGVRVVDARYAGFAAADAGAAPVSVRAAARTLQLRNSFVSAVGWVKPGQTYPSRIVVTNPTGRALSGARVVVTAPRGTTFRSARGAGARSVSAKRITWRPGTVRPGRTVTLVVTSRAQTLRQQPTLVWRDLSTRATLTQGTVRRTVRSHGPKVIPPNETYETARYGDRPFPVVPVQYVDRSFSASHSGGDLDRVINARSLPGSTFNLFQEMSLGQLFPNGTVPSAGIATAGFDYAPGFPLTTTDPATVNTCTGVTFADSPVPAQGTPLYPERITDGVYNLPGTTQYYGADANGSAVIGSLAGVAALQQIDSGCGPTGKIVADAAALADPEVDYSDFDTDKDGVVDFFMAVFAGCGGNGASQLGACTDEATDAAPYDNIWPHSSSLEFYLTDPVTGLPGFATDDQLKDLQGRPLYWADASYSRMTTKKTSRKVFVRVGPYNLNPETAIDKASVISHEYGHSLGLPDFYSLGGRETYGDWNLMATDKSQHMDAYSRQELGWVVPRVLPKRRTLTVDRFTDSKQDIGTITWRTPGGKPYTLRRGRDGIVQNSLMYVARLKGRKLLDPAKFATGDGATRSHAWFSGSGNDFGCATDGGGRNLDIALPGARTLPAGSTISVSMKSMWDIEWDYDYGYVLTSRDGRDFASHPSENGYTTSNTDPLSGNPNQNGCQAAYDNGLTGTSGSYDAGTEAVDRKLGETPEAIFLADSYDVSELVGAKSPILRFSYATDPGLARPGWFVDDVVVTATLPNGSKRTLFRSDFERSGSPEDPQVFNGGCKADGPGTCTLGWNYVQAGQAADFDHAYYLEMRDRSGFDLDGKGQVDRDPIAFQPGLSLVYTDEAHGYGNAGTDDPPAQSPLDATPTPGSATPDLSDAAWTAAKGRNTFSDAGKGHVDNYTDPSRQGRDGSGDTAWRFDFGCLTFRVLSMSGQRVGPKRADGDLTGRVRFTTGRGCGPFDYGYRR
ncbi:immune inhibitor A domain-containing protein [Nocardioides perillae]|uniref:M6 family metalloprotease-like protein n=1 Tax=Nocardioides perillae TaxID=1119534 RepID=A0A7Y9UJE7_9ACTN|nr:immune inhibitor A domain-containing protein [Nocardioides perillae]NYG54148.1 M6 family metalloprotease-like protein [Nocardioides perillae]